MRRIWKVLALVGGVVCLLLACLVFLAGAWLWGRTFNYQSAAVWLAPVVVILGSGSVLIGNALLSLGGRPSRGLRLPPLWALGWGFVLLLLVGELLRRTALAVVIFPPILLTAAALPPLAALAWVLGSSDEGLTRRQFGTAFVCGATFSVVLALVLELLLPGLLLVLVDGLFELLRDALDASLQALFNRQVAQALASYSFVAALVELAVVAPLAEEFAKPLLVLPMLRHARSPRHAFLIGAAAGAGFAALENALYAGFGETYWSGVLAVRALGAAVHPLGAGLVAVGWYYLLYPVERRRLSVLALLSRFGLALGAHALWNGGITLLLALAGANFFGANPPTVDVLDVSLAGVLLALLALLGAAVWFGVRAAVRAPADAGAALPSLLPATDRAVAVWALACLVAALVMGLSALRVLGGGG